jgi:phospholipid transport system substrate-binding protein
MKHHRLVKIGLRVFICGWLSMGLVMAQTINFSQNNPVQLLSQVAKKIDSRLKQEFKAGGNNKALFLSIVHDELLPILDLDQLIVNVIDIRYWKKAGAKEQVDLKHYFKSMVLNTYVGAINNYSGHKVYFRRYGGKPHAHYALVRSLIVLPDKQKVHVNYTMRRDHKRWKVLDFTIDGISFASNYRAQFLPILREHGIAGLLKKLKALSKGQGDKG